MRKSETFPAAARSIGRTTTKIPRPLRTKMTRTPHTVVQRGGCHPAGLASRTRRQPKTHFFSSFFFWGPVTACRGVEASTCHYVTKLLVTRGTRVGADFVRRVEWPPASRVRSCSRSIACVMQQEGVKANVREETWSDAEAPTAT